MKPSQILLLLFVTLGITGCDLVGDLIELGFWAAIILVVVVVALITWVWNRIRGSGRRP